MIATAHRIRSTDGIDGKDAVGLYLDGIAKTPLLTAEEEVQLAKLIEAGRYPFAKLHTHSFPIEQAEDAIHALAGDIPGMNPVHLAIVPGAPRVALPG